MNKNRLAGAAVIIALTAGLGACSAQSLESPAISTPDMSLPLEERIATPNDEQAKSLLDSLATVNPRLADDRNITRAMSTCSDILGGKDDATIASNAKTRYSGGDFEATEADAAKIVEIVQNNGFCAAI